MSVDRLTSKQREYLVGKNLVFSKEGASKPPWCNNPDPYEWGCRGLAEPIRCAIRCDECDITKIPEK